LATVLNDFTSALSNRKYLYNSVTRNGFKEDSPIFSVAYLNDLISLLMLRNKIVDNQGISWGYQGFSTNLKFNPQNLCLMEKDPMFEQKLSEDYLCLAQKMDFQFRVTGKWHFHKYQIVFPLIIFHTFKELNENDFIQIEYMGKIARSTFEKSRTIIVVETLMPQFVPDLKNSAVDCIFILRKQFTSGKEAEIDHEVIEKLDCKIKEIIMESEDVTVNFIKTGIIE
ncbi:MAG: hypothetical protein JW996_06720, partial [Candidatus Cloacimonetes bacterium]|nr:hypothetical protein [Candidatus Cloacimonadota bacterium]